MVDVPHNRHHKIIDPKHHLTYPYFDKKLIFQIQPAGNS